MIYFTIKVSVTMWLGAPPLPAAVTVTLLLPTAVPGSGGAGGGAELPPPQAGSHNVIHSRPTNNPSRRACRNRFFAFLPGRNATPNKP